MLITESQLRKMVREEILREETGALNVVLDLAGLIPGVGEAADVINALLYAKKGDYLMAALSLVSLIPVAGDAVGKGGKVAVWLTKLATKEGKIGDIAKVAATQGPKVAAGIKKAQKMMADNKDSINKVFEVAKKNEKLKGYIPQMQKALEAFYTAGTSTDTSTGTQTESLFRKTKSARLSREDRLFESRSLARKTKSLR